MRLAQCKCNDWALLRKTPVVLRHSCFDHSVGICALDSLAISRLELLLHFTVKWYRYVNLDMWNVTNAMCSRYRSWARAQCSCMLIVCIEIETAEKSPQKKNKKTKNFNRRRRRSIKNNRFKWNKKANRSPAAQQQPWSMAGYARVQQYEDAHSVYI